MKFVTPFQCSHSAFVHQMQPEDTILRNNVDTLWRIGQNKQLRKHSIRIVSPVVIYCSRLTLRKMF